ncbi:hypothetical protein DPMN_175292 [Dreissena polymorpha]|uniref:Uncharacterized protein n=1 Tax=Dreissena polymorpha TaxID=45954 RepID=A0A9D4E7Z2_DREPO|nr:hypothetical protein DPMN_175292 [Dreissena polymorpha]
MQKGGERGVSAITRENALSIEADQSCSPPIQLRQYKSAYVVSQDASSDRQHPQEDPHPNTTPRPITIRQTSVHGDGTSYQDQAQSLSGIATGMKSSGNLDLDKQFRYI